MGSNRNYLAFAIEYVNEWGWGPWHHRANTTFKFKSERNGTVLGCDMENRNIRSKIWFILIGLQENTIMHVLICNASYQNTSRLVFFLLFWFITIIYWALMWAVFVDICTMYQLIVRTSTVPCNKISFVVGTYFIILNYHILMHAVIVFLRVRLKFMIVFRWLFIFDNLIFGLHIFLAH